MSNFYMGAELGALELPLGSPVPENIPHEGVIVPRAYPDGWTRKYLHQMGRNPICIAEIPPQPVPELSGIPEVVAAQEEAPQAPRLDVLQMSSPLPMSQPVRVPVPGNNSPFMMGGPVAMRRPEPPAQAQPARMAVMSSPLPIFQSEPQEQPRPIPAAQPSNLAGEIAVIDNSVRLGQTGINVPGPRPAQGRSLPMLAGDPELASVEDPTCGICPSGPLQLPDGKIVQLDDPITLQDLCLMMPSILRGIQGPGAPGAPGAMPTAPYGQGPVPLQRAAGGSFPGFGPAGGMFGQGGAGGGGGGGAPGPLGVVNQAAPQGAGAPAAQGPVGPQGPAGTGSIVDFVTKVDGDFTAGPGSFVPVPGASLTFTQGVAGTALVFLQATYGCRSSMNNALGIRVDGGATIPISVALLDPIFPFFTSVVFVPTTGAWPLVLTAGSHTIEVMFRGVGAGEFCGAAGQGISADLSATPDAPLALSVLHS